MAEVWGEDLAKVLVPKVNPTMGTWGRLVTAAWRTGEDPNRKTFEAFWGRPVTNGRVLDDDPTMEAWGRIVAAEQLAGDDPTDRTLEALGGPIGCLVCGPPW